MLACGGQSVSPKSPCWTVQTPSGEGGERFSRRRRTRPRSKRSSACNSIGGGKSTCSVVRSAHCDDGMDFSGLEGAEYGSLMTFEIEGCWDGMVRVVRRDVKS